MKNLCVFCGSSSGSSEKYSDLARSVGELIAKKKWGLVYGGGKAGLMGTLADTVLKNGSEVTGVIPKNLMSREVAHLDLTKLHLVESMHDRKKLMYALSDAFLILPGGMGTLDEMFEIITWAQLKLHSKPIFILNEFGFYDSLIHYIEHSSREGFIKAEHLKLFNVLKTAEELVDLNF